MARSVIKKDTLTSRININMVSPFTMTDSGANRHVAISGNVCLINGEIAIPSGSYQSTTTIATGLPKPKRLLRLIGINNDGITMILYVTTDGQLQLGKNFQVTQTLYITVCSAYPFESLT